MQPDSKPTTHAEQKAALTETAEFWFACGIVGGLAIGLGIGYWLSYQQGLNYAAQALTDYIATLPLACQQALEGDSVQTIILPQFNITTNGSVMWIG